MRTPDASGRRKFAGVLRGAAAGQVSIELEGRVVGLALDDLDKARLIPDLK
jgi:ribosome maturation factor RimP